MENKILFKKGKWIWENACMQKDEYADFFSTFISKKESKQFLSISCDSNYTVYINKELVSFGQYPDYPNYKVGDIIDISDYTHQGENEILIQVWYYGKGNMSYTPGIAGLIFEISENDNIIAYSSETTLSRLSYGYISHNCKNITSQLGFTYEYNSLDKERSYSKSYVIDSITYDINLRPIKKMEMKNRTPFHKSFGGTYIFDNSDDPLPIKMQNAYLSYIRGDRQELPNKPFTLKSSDGNNVYFIIDLERETSGFLDFDITTDEDCDLYIAYGEHLSDGRVRTLKRNFTCIYHAKKGRNQFLNTFRRFGLRYLQVYVTSKNIKVDYFGIRPTEYPLNIKKPQTNSLLRDTIYTYSEHTLITCMHDHYEDCPWREQGLYAMDSRNQMLFGYYAFSEHVFARASLKLMSYGQRENDKLLSICFPSDEKLTIPSFSLMYFVEMWEYIKYTKDTSLAYECYNVLTSLMKAFLDKIQDNDLCLNFTGDDGDYWGFYEWSETLTGEIKGEKESRYECALNAYLSFALKHMSKISASLGKTDDADYYLNISKRINKAIMKYFWKKEDKLFVSQLSDKKYSTLVNAMCILCLDDISFDTTNIVKMLKLNSSFDNIYVVPITLSMHVFRYDALLKISKDYSSFILDDIDKTYLYMLQNNATTFWETIKGEDDFDMVGSLCHGWSALPIYYYETLIKEGNMGEII